MGAVNLAFDEASLWADATPKHFDDPANEVGDCCVFVCFFSCFFFANAVGPRDSQLLPLFLFFLSGLSGQCTLTNHYTTLSPCSTQCRHDGMHSPHYRASPPTLAAKVKRSHPAHCTIRHYCRTFCSTLFLVRHSGDQDWNYRHEPCSSQSDLAPRLQGNLVFSS